MNKFLWGALSMSAWTAGLFFLRFWCITRERLFVFMSVTFILLGLNWLCLALLDVTVESRHQVYVLRLASQRLSSRDLPPRLPGSAAPPP
jgi:hypothetical protein